MARSRIEPHEVPADLDPFHPPDQFFLTKSGIDNIAGLCESLLQLMKNPEPVDMIPEPLSTKKSLPEKSSGKAPT